MSEGSPVIRQPQQWADSYRKIFTRNKYSWLFGQLPLHPGVNQRTALIDFGQMCSFYLFLPIVQFQDREKFFDTIRSCAQKYSGDLDLQSALNGMRRLMRPEILSGLVYNSGGFDYLDQGQRVVSNRDLELLFELFSDNPSDPFTLSKGLRVRHAESTEKLVEYLRGRIPSLEERSKIYAALILSAAKFGEQNDVDNLFLGIRKYERSPKVAELLTRSLAKQMNEMNSRPVVQRCTFDQCAKALRGFLRTPNDVRTFSHKLREGLLEHLPIEVLLRWHHNNDINDEQLKRRLTRDHGNHDAFLVMRTLTALREGPDIVRTVAKQHAVISRDLK